MAGIELAEAFYHRAVRPLLGDLPHAAALLGAGSEVLGYDDRVSTDHDFGPRTQLFLPPGVDAAPVHAALDRLPERFEGHPVRFALTGDPRHPRHGVEVSTAAEFFTHRLGEDPVTGMSLAGWLVCPTQLLAGLTGGAVFHDPGGALARRRAALAWYPDDVWRYALAAAWLRIGQEEAFVGRTGGTGDDLGSRVVAARVVRDLIRLAFLVERRWAPYSKWLGRAFGELPVAAALRPHLDSALDATGWREREAALCAAGQVLGEATNHRGLCPPVDPAPRRFYDRDIRVIGGERFTVALTASIVDGELRRLLDGLGDRHGIGRSPGTIDQAVDSVDVLSDPVRSRAAAGLLGLPGTVSPADDA